MDAAFFIDAIGDESNEEVFRDNIVSMTYVGAGGQESVVNFDGIAILTPRGRYNIELHLSFLRLQGQANDFNIQYSSVVRVFWLPKSNQQHTFVVVTLDPPIRQGQTLYPHIVMQFETDAAMETTLSMCEELYKAKYKDKLKLEHKGLVHEIFTEILSGLSEAKVTKPGKFHSRQGGYAVNSILKGEDGVLFPLEESFFFLPNPPTLILHEEIDYVEFVRHTARGPAIHYFDLLIKLKTKEEHLFRNIQRNVFNDLFLFTVHKGLKIMNLGTLKNVDKFPTHLWNNEAIGDESFEEEHFFVERRDKGSVTPRKRACAFMLFSHIEKKKLVKSNPEISLSELGKELGDRWTNMAAEEKSVYEAKALGYKNT